MKRISFRPNEEVKLVMPCSEVMLHMRLAGHEQALKVLPLWRLDGSVGREVLFSRGDLGWIGSGCTLSECGIYEQPDGTFTGDQAEAGDPTPAETQKRAWECADQLSKLLEDAGAVTIQLPDLI